MQRREGLVRLLLVLCSIVPGVAPVAFRCRVVGLAKRGERVTQGFDRKRAARGSFHLKGGMN